MPYIGTQPKDVRSFGRAKFDFTATQGQTAFTGADDDSKTLGFTEGKCLKNVWVPMVSMCHLKCVVPYGVHVSPKMCEPLWCPCVT